MKAQLFQLQAEKERGFLIETSAPSEPHYQKLTHVQTITLESRYRVVDPQPYLSKNRQELDRYIRECANVFEIRPVTYREDEDKIKYAQLFLRDTPFTDWSRMSAVIRKEHRTWAYYVEFLQNKLKPRHLREIEVGGLLKKCRQRPGQKVSELVSYIESLEVQLVEVPTESQRHSHLLHALHDYLKDAIVRSDR